MTDKQIIDGVDVRGCSYFAKRRERFLGILQERYKCEMHYNEDCLCEIRTNCYYKQLKRKEQEYEELRQYHNKCCEENAKKETEWLEKYNQVSRDFYDGKYCDKENCNLLKAKEQRIVELNKTIKAKEQKCERLKEINCIYSIGVKQANELKGTLEYKQAYINNVENYNEQLNEQLDQLKVENDYLKHKIFRYEEIFKHSADMIKNPVTAIEVETFQSGVKALGNSLIAEENNKLHKTLTEIKEVAEKSYRTPLAEKDCIKCDDFLEQILQKISEVLNA